MKGVLFCGRNCIFLVSNNISKLSEINSSDNYKIFKSNWEF